MNKLERLRAAFYRDGRADCGIVITSEQARRYFTDFPSSDGVFAVTATDAVFLTDSRYIEAAEAAVTGVRVEEQKETYKQLQAFFTAG